MKLTKQVISKLIIVVILAEPSSVFAVFGIGDMVFDPSNTAQSIISATEETAQTLKQIEEYAAQLEQYQTQLQNTVAPAAYLWDKATTTIDKLRNATSMLDYYKNKYGNIEGYLNKFKDVSYYRNSPCFKLSSCSESELKALHDSLAYASEVQNKANESLVKDLNLQQDALDQDAASLQMLQSRAQGADGQMKALQYANQLASAEINQLLQLRQLMIAAQNAAAARAQVLADIEAKQSAAAEYLRTGLGSPVKSSAVWQFK